MKKRSLIFLSITIVMLVGVSNLVFGQSDVLSSYRSYQDIAIPKINVPTVVELPISNINFERYDSLVYNKTNKTFEPSLVVGQQIAKAISARVVNLISNETLTDSQNLVDNDDRTYIELPIVSDGKGFAQIALSSNDLITADSIYVLLDNYVALPNTIQISVEGPKVVLATKKMESQSVYFPKTTAKNWTITLNYSQPLRITGIRLGSQDYNKNIYSLRFLAQPNSDYSVYFNPDRRVPVSVGEMANLSDNRDVIKLSSSVSKDNPSYIIADTDGDKIPDVRDNCVSISNTDQADVNQNGRGDVCDDFDKDGVMNSLDNCRDLPNVSQIDTDGDKIGDVCDSGESRLTEKYKWLPWLGIVAAAVVVAGLFVLTAISMRKKEDLPPQN